MSDTDHTNDMPAWWPTDTNGSDVVVKMPDRPAPPPPPPAPPTPASDNTAPVVVADAPAKPNRVAAARVHAQRNRRWIALAGVVILVLFVGHRWATNLANSVGAGVAKPLAEHNTELSAMVAQIAANESAPSQVSVQQPLAWLNCPVTQDAGTMIGYDPNTQYATLDPGRASAVETQVRALVVQNPLESLRITAPDPTTLTVMVGGTKGVPLVDCSAGVTTARKDGGDAATTPTTAAR